MTLQDPCDACPCTDKNIMTALIALGAALFARILIFYIMWRWGNRNRNSDGNYEDPDADERPHLRPDPSRKHRVALSEVHPSRRKTRMQFRRDRDNFGKNFGRGGKGEGRQSCGNANESEDGLEAGQDGEEETVRRVGGT
ncbi:hypothetical protein K458DRAFT_408648 [Lentithecium fluviatile CBS 122367]|uniref:Uncharacterized protein n=1 Tax=Lentithecium fluviatile CBS 122367 TaxID=1168545 RepID=A0A6G1IL80_9PLEO|nr:hypothetical protein K458DRAFT_408648 [Lentithecium fluviatile CBS 122367]